MTLVTATVEDVRGMPDNTVWVFHPLAIEGGDGNEITTTDYVRVNPVDGALSVDLKPGFRAVAFRGKEYTIEVPESGPVDLWDLLSASIAFPPGTPPTMVAQAVMGYLAAHPLDSSNISDATAIGKAVMRSASTAAARSAIEALGLVQAAKNPDLLVTGAVTVDEDDLITAAAVVWPDGSPGTLTITSRDANSAVLSYNITYGSPVSKTYTQPAITRNDSGAATNVPAIVVT